MNSNKRATRKDNGRDLKRTRLNSVTDLALHDSTNIIDSSLPQTSKIPNSRSQSTSSISITRHIGIQAQESPTSTNKADKRKING